MIMAIYLDEHKLTFIHIPKCGGTSVSRWLTNLGAVQRGGKHDGIQHVKPEYYHYTPFSVVRNPWSRLVSWFHYDTKINADKVARGKGKGDYGKQHQICKLGFDYWLNYGLDYKNTWFIHKTPQYKWIPANIEYIFKLETINEEFKVIQDLVGCNKPLQKKNTTKHKGYRSYYTPATMNLVANIYKRDIERFNYDF